MISLILMIIKIRWISSDFDSAHSWNVINYLKEAPAVTLGSFGKLNNRPLNINIEIFAKSVLKGSWECVPTTRIKALGIVKFTTKLKFGQSWCFGFFVCAVVVFLRKLWITLINLITVKLIRQINLLFNILTPHTNQSIHSIYLNWIVCEYSICKNNKLWIWDAPYLYQLDKCS